MRALPVAVPVTLVAEPLDNATNSASAVLLAIAVLILAYVLYYALRKGDRSDG